MKAYDGMVFKGNCVGIKLTARSQNDPHICFSFMTEDDGNWFDTPTGSGWSNYWWEDLKEVMVRVENTLSRTAKKTKWGYEFK